MTDTGTAEPFPARAIAFGDNAFRLPNQEAPLPGLYEPGTFPFLSPVFGSTVM